VPLTPTGKVVPGWTPTAIGAAGATTFLVSATDALLGLRNGVFSLYPKQVIFAVADSKTDTVYKWQPTVGVSEFTTRENLDVVKLGFQAAETGGDIDWGPTIKIAKGTCYWTNPVIQGRPGK
jgi:hypothetical protein